MVTHVTHVTHGVNPITIHMCNSLMGPFINPLGTPDTPTLNSLNNHQHQMQKLWRCSRKIGNIIAEIRENWKICGLKILQGMLIC